MIDRIGVKIKLNNTMKLPACLFLMLIFIFTSELNAKEKKYTAYTFRAGAGLNGNLYTSSFTNLPGYYGCCTEYTGAFGIGYGFNAGMDYNLRKSILGSDISISILAGFNNISAKFSEEEFIGNIIQGNDYTKGISDFIIDPTINLLTIDPGVSFGNIAGLPISVRIGMQFGIPMTKSMEQMEELKSPSGVTFENGTTTRDFQEGDINEFTGLYMAATASVSYEVYRFGDFAIMPEIKFNYGLNNMVKDVDWKANYFQGVVNLTYRLPVTPSEPPKKPPLPSLPEPTPPPAPGVLALSANIEVDGEAMKDNDKIITKVYTKKIRTVESLIPLVFFGENEYEISASKYDNGAPSIEDLKSVLTDNHGAKIQLTAYALDSEKPGTAGKRLESGKKILESGGMKPKDYKTNEIIIKTSELPHTEMQDEYRRLEFNLPNSDMAIQGTEKEIVSGGEVMPLEIKPVIKSDGQKIKFTGVVSFNGKTIANINKKGSAVELNTNNYPLFLSDKKPGEIDINIEVVDEDGQKRTETVKLIIEKTKIVSEEVTNIVSENGTDAEQYVLGLCEFDRSDFYSINREALKKAREALRFGGKIVLIPMTDSFGTDEHNSMLSSRRAKEAIRLIGGDSDNVIIRESDGYYFDNSTPYGRMLNRSVIIRIMKK